MENKNDFDEEKERESTLEEIVSLTISSSRLQSQLAASKKPRIIEDSPKRFDRAWFYAEQNDKQDDEEHDFDKEKLREIRELAFRMKESLDFRPNFAIEFFASLRWVSCYDKNIKLHFNLIDWPKKMKKKYKFKVHMNTNEDFIDSTKEYGYLLLFLVLNSSVISGLIVRRCSKHLSKEVEHHEAIRECQDRREIFTPEVKENNILWTALTAHNLAVFKRERDSNKKFEDDYNIEDFTKRKEYKPEKIYSFVKCIRNLHQHTREYTTTEFRERLYRGINGARILYKLIIPEDNLAFFIIYLQCFLCPFDDDAHIFEPFSHYAQIDNRNGDGRRFDIHDRKPREKFVDHITFFMAAFFDIHKTEVEDELHAIFGQVFSPEKELELAENIKWSDKQSEKCRPS